MSGLRAAAALATSNLIHPGREAVMRHARDAYAGLPVVAELEARLAEFHQAAHCVALCSGFWALVLSMRALALPGRGDVLMPSLTYRRMADVAAWAGLRPRFCEVGAATLACSAATMRAGLHPNVGLLLAVHPIVNTCGVGGIVALAQEEGLPLLFDSVESVYEAVEEGKVGSFGDAECFSLHASKLLNGYEGGYVTTGSAALAARLVALRDGSAVDGMDLRLNRFHAAMALASLDDLDDQVRRNRERYHAYRRLLAPLPGLRLVPFDERYPCSFKNILVELTPAWPRTAAETLARLNAAGMLACPYYDPPLHLRPMAYPHVPAFLPGTAVMAGRYMLLPCGHHVGLDDIAAVVWMLRELAA